MTQSFSAMAFVFIPLITHLRSHDVQANYFYCVLCLTKCRFNEAQRLMFVLAVAKITDEIKASK